MVGNYPYGVGAIHFSNFICNGNEENLTSCLYSPAPSYCSHSSDVGVICRGNMLLETITMQLKDDVLILSRSLQRWRSSVGKQHSI